MCCHLPDLDEHWGSALMPLRKGSIFIPSGYFLSVKFSVSGLYWEHGTKIHECQRHSEEDVVEVIGKTYVFICASKFSSSNLEYLEKNLKKRSLQMYAKQTISLRFPKMLLWEYFWYSVLN